MSLFHYRVIVLDPENQIVNLNGQVVKRYSYVLDHSVFAISLSNNEIIASLVCTDDSSVFFESRCVRPDDWREVDTRILRRCFRMLTHLGVIRCRPLFSKHKIFLIIRNPMIKAVFEKLLENDKFKCKYIRTPDMIAPGYVAVSQE